MKVNDSPLSVVPAATARVAQGSGQSEQVEQKPLVKDKVSVSSSPANGAAVDAARQAVASSRAARVQEITNAESGRASWRERVYMPV
jgi:hypothetical protein